MATEHSMTPRRAVKRPSRRKVQVNPAVDRLHAAFRKHEGAAFDKMELAQAYISDGAYASGSIVLRAAADEFYKAQAARNDALSIMAKP